MIPTVTVSADKNPTYGTNAGNATEDKLFLLSITEAYKYFETDGERYCELTEYAAAKKGASRWAYWWLRSPGSEQYTVAAVYNDGHIYESGNLADKEHAIRPAMWISIE